MSLHRLVLHPDSRCDAVTGIKVEVRRVSGRGLNLRFVTNGDIGRVKTPTGELPPARRDELWRTTCFEAFARAKGSTAYLEFNVAPWGAWAAYAFDSYREGMRPTDHEAGLAEMKSSATTLEMLVHAELEDDGPLELGISAVIEDTDGRISYWALAHPSGKPDFHHPDCFALELPAMAAP